MPRAAQTVAGALAAAVVAVLACAGPALAAGPPPGGRVAPNTDSRRDDRRPSPAARSSRGALERALGAQGVVSSDPRTGAARLVARRDGFLTAAAPGDPLQIALDYVGARPGVFGLDGDDLSALRLTSRYRSPDGVTHLAWIQTAKGIGAYDNTLLANVAQDGGIVNVGGSAVADLTVASTDPGVGAARALAVAHANVGGALGAPRATQPAGAERATSFSNGDRARLAIFSDGRSDRLAWRVQVTDEDEIAYELVIDATSEQLLLRRSLTEFLSPAAVHEDFPGAPSGGDAVTVDLGADPAWLDRSLGATRLAGNNAHAYADTGGSNGVDAGEDIPASTGTDWLYPRTLFAVGSQSCPLLGLLAACSWNPGSGASKAANRNQATTQLFYLVNRFHDHLAAPPIGFTHAARNFEFADADGAGPGLGGDPVLAEGNDSSGSDNANMSTPSDGGSPRMQMYFWTDPATNSSDAADVVFHEYAHGLTNRSVGTGSGLSSGQSRAMGEGWSDWYALDYLVGEGHRTDTAAHGELTLAGYLVPPAGIRRQPIDCPVGASAPACPGTSGAGPGGYTLGDMGHVIGSFQVHADGEIWSQTLWDLRRALGATTARALVTGGLRLAPDNPSFLDMRDAIIQADQVLGGTRYDALWSLFAARGMGHSAFTASADADSAVEAFDLPPVLVEQAATVTDPAPGGDADGIAEPGETLRVESRLRNPSTGPVSGVSAVLSATTPGVTVTQPAATWPDFAGGETHAGAPAFAVALPLAHECGAPVALTLDYTTGQGDGTIALTIPTGTPASSAPSADVPKPIGSSAGFDSALTFAAGGAVQNLEVRIPSLTHTWVGDLYMTLTSPAGTTVVLMNSPGPGGPGDGAMGDDLTELVLADDASTPVESLPLTAPAGGYGGRYRPDQPLSAFNGEDRAGTWKLHVHDVYPGSDTGVLHSWGLVPAGAPTCTSAGNAGPLAVDDARSTPYGQPLAGTSVLANDSDPDGDALTAVKQTEPAHGTVALATDGTFTYTPAAGFEGVDSFAYRAHDATVASAIATVRITVAPRPNAAPVAADDAYGVAANATFHGPSVLANDGDGDGDPLTAVLSGGPAHGSVALASNGTFSYTPSAGYSGADEFRYRAHDGRTTSALGRVTITVRPPNRAPQAVDDSFATTASTALDGAGVLANDSDPDGDQLAAALDRGPANGTLSLAGDGTFRYVPEAGFAGTDQFSYTASDGTTTSAPAFVTVVVSRPLTVTTFLPRPERSAASPARVAADLHVLRAALRGGRLDVLATIAADAAGSATVTFRTRRTATSHRVPVVRGRIQLRRALARGQRSAASGILRVSYSGSDRVAPDSVSLRAAPRRAYLRLRDARIAGGRLVVSGMVARAVRGRVAIRFTYERPGGGRDSLRYGAAIRHGRWSLRQALPLRATVADGRVWIRYGGDGARRIRGEQVATDVSSR